MFSKLALRVNSRSTYASHHRTFIKLCSNVGFDPLIMLTERQLCMVMIDYVRTHKVTTLPTYISAIANWFHEHELGDLPRHRLFTRVQRGIQNVFGLSEVTEPKAALSLSDLAVFHSRIDHSSFEGARDWFAYVLAFFGLLRIGEYISPTLTHKHVASQQWGIEITIPFSKTNLQPVQVRLIRRDDTFDPVMAYDNYVSHIAPKLRLPSLPFFLAQPARSTVLQEHEFVATLKQRVKSWLAKDPAVYAGHSFRRGGTTALFLAGVPETVISAHGRWKSLAYRRYFDSTANVLLPTYLLAKHAKQTSINPPPYSP
jgi:hypothetical protein